VEHAYGRSDNPVQEDDMATTTRKPATTRKRSSAAKATRPRADGDHARETLERMADSLEAAQEAGKALRGDLGKGSRDLLREIERMMQATRKDVVKLNKAVRADLADLQKAVTHPKRKPAR
jgi:hypothetical protein